MRNLFILVVLILNLSLSAQNSKIEIIGVKPTPFFPKVEKGEALKQLVKLSIENKTNKTPIKLKIEVEGLEAYYQDLGTLEKGSSVHDIMIADINKATKVNLELLNSRGKIVAQKTLIWKPQKKWKVYYAAVSHHDLGFITYYQNLRKAVRESEIDTALVYCRKTDGWDENSQFRWNVETSEALIRWMAKQTPEKIKEFERRIQEGRIEIIANHNTISTQMVGYEMMARSFYTPNRYVQDMLDIDPAKVALINDVTGVSRTWPLYLKEADIPYFMHGSNHPNNLQDMIDQPVFRWLSTDGDNEKAPLCKADSYYSPNKIAKWDLDGVSYLINRHVDLDWKFDCILAYDSHDFAIPSMQNANNIKEWNSKYEYPKFRCSVISSYFDDIAQQLKPGMIQETAKDAPDSWNDQEIIDANLLARARKASSEIPTTEKLASIAMTLGGEYPEKELFQAYNRIIMYHEHTNGAIDGGNHKYYETENVMHEKLVDEAIDINEQALSVSLQKLGSQIQSKKSALVVYNPLNWKRDELVYFKASKLPFEHFQIIDADTKKPIQVQKLKDGRFAFYAENIPSMGYKSYTIKETKKAGYSSSSISEANSIENDFYQISIDRTKNIISDVIDKQLDKNIIDKTSPYALGEYIHYDHFSGEWKKTKFTGIKYYKGAVLDEIHISQDAYLTGKVELVVYIHHKIKKIDFALEVDKLSNGEELTGGWNRYMKEAAFCAIPVSVPDYQHHHELSGAVTQPGNKDLQFEASESAFYAIQHFADASNDNFGVTLSTIETNCINYGYPRPVYWNNDGRRPKEEIVKPKNSNMFLYLMNNFFQTNVKVDQPGIKNYTFSIRSHSGDWKGGKAYQFAWETSNPIISQYIEKNKEGKLPSKKSFLSTDKDNVVISTLKKAEANGDGLVVRLFELAGKDSKVKMKLNLNKDINKAVVLNLLENDEEEISVSNNEVEFNINGHGIKNIRLLSEPSQKPIVSNVTALAVSNEEVKLSWEGDNSSFYNIYRSKSPDFKLNALNYLGYSEGTSYLDKTVLDYAGGRHKRVEPNTTYYYKVEPVDEFNNRGIASQTIKCTTLKTEEADAKPNKVQGVYTVHVSPLAPEDFINLWFYSNFEKDVDKYLIHRGESADFVPNKSNLINTLIPSEGTFSFHYTYSNSELNRQMFEDKTAKVNTAYYYKVAAVDNSGNVGEYSDAAYAYMEKIPVEIKHEYIATKEFKTFRPKAKVSIECSEPGYDMYYSTETRTNTSKAKKYSGPFEITEASVINVEVYKANTKELAYRYRRFVNVNQNISQSDYNGHFNSLKATDGSYYSGWVSKQFGNTKEEPKDVWLGVNLGELKTVGGLTVISDNGDIFPIHDQFRVFVRNGENVKEVKFTNTPDKKIRNKFHVTFDEPLLVDGVMIYFDKDKLPVKGGRENQAGLVRINELLILDQKGESILRSDILGM
ncbi:hypothetical protein BWZ22_09835 [Seonamhaeicola sp. S2-3]|uniref:glycoside hydrolase family 38 N-terminal domain-containing protein n=1 Tax=Seonamhaeicola sp. S2-3 TaxID=1936081 RepID=UPI000972DA75|nr:glycosyl hydrolase-related protein [Seonamhaeicola sp. S2-3]APY11524.1 hypothetical protein BWZ22_09835 [Seonamhaeicola sp. S2-3]